MKNPSLLDVAKGDVFNGMIQSIGDHVWVYESIVLSVGELSKRFGLDDKIITVCVRAVHGDRSPATVVDASKLLWHSQLVQGLV